MFLGRESQDAETATGALTATATLRRVRAWARE
jgi:hypothetical protein